MSSSFPNALISLWVRKRPKASPGCPFSCDAARAHLWRQRDSGKGRGSSSTTCATTQKKSCIYESGSGPCHGNAAEGSATVAGTTAEGGAMALKALRSSSATPQVPPASTAGFCTPRSEDQGAERGQSLSQVTKNQGRKETNSGL